VAGTCSSVDDAVKDLKRTLGRRSGLCGRGCARSRPIGKAPRGRFRIGLSPIPGWPGVPTWRPACTPWRRSSRPFWLVSDRITRRDFVGLRGLLGLHVLMCTYESLLPSRKITEEERRRRDHAPIECASTYCIRNDQRITTL
jgi:hypothetical protein